MPTFNRICSSSNAFRCSFSFVPYGWGNKDSLKFFSMYVFRKDEHNSSILSTSIESRESCSHTSWISSTTRLKEDLTFSSFSKAKDGISFKASDNSGLEWYKFFSPSSPILRIKFCDKWKKHPDILALGNAFSKAFIAASSKSIKTLSGAAFGRSDNRISRKRLYVLSVLFGKKPYTLMQLKLRGLKLHLILWSSRRLFSLRLFPSKYRGCGSLESKSAAPHL